MSMRQCDELDESNVAIWNVSYRHRPIDSLTSCGNTSLMFNLNVHCRYISISVIFELSLAVSWGSNVIAFTIGFLQWVVNHIALLSLSSCRTVSPGFLQWAVNHIATLSLSSCRTVSLGFLQWAVNHIAMLSLSSCQTVSSASCSEP